MSIWSSAQGRFLASVRLLTLAFLALHLVAGALPEDQAWGVWPFSTLPLLVRFGALLAAALLIWPPVHRAVEAAWDRIQRLGGPRLPRAWGRALLAGLAAVPFWFGRLVHTRWGDAYILTQAIPHPEVRLTYTWQAPLDVFLHAKLWTLAHAWWGWDVMRLYNVVSVAAGVVFLYLLLWASEDWGRSPLERNAFVGLVASLGMMQLFFGYVENYTLIPIGILAFLWLGLRHLQGRAPLWAVSLSLALTNAFHPSTLVLWPAVLVLLGWRGRMGWCSLRAWAEAVLPPFVVGAMVLILMESGGHGLEALLGADFPGGGDRRWWVPLFRTETRWEHYTLFSVGHLLDVVNEQLLVAPFTLALLALAYSLLRQPRALADPGERFLAAAGLSYLALTLVWNPDYGGRRDWDLFAPAALPLTAWLAYILPRRLEDARTLSGTAWAVLPAAFAHLAGWVYSNTLPWSWP
ncbi:MAG: hypothetical protein ACP5UM_11970 [Anaerolineae bacterium]